MTCPDKVFLQSFARDPDAALDLDPTFGIHLSQCEACRAFLDVVGQSRQSFQISELLTIGEPNPMPLPSIEGYTIQEFIGAGASGTVYKAEQTSSGLEVAIKFVHGLTSDQWKRIEIERQTLIQCDHPNIVQLLDYGRSRESCFFVTRWAEQSLAKMIQETLIIDLKDAVNWTIQIANALSHLHGLGIVHRDLKPSNVLLTSNKVPKLIDFGIAKNLNAKSTLTGLNTPLGTPGYMAPEQAGKTDLSVGFRTDVYGLGAVLYTLITGRPPFVGSDSVQVIHQVLEDTPIAPRMLRPETPKDLQTICLKCLEKRPSDRYGSAQELSEDLTRFLKGIAIKAKPTSRSVLVWRSIAKHRIQVSLIALTCCISAISAFAIIRTRWQNEKQAIEFAKVALLNAIASASVEKLPQLYGEASFKLGDGLPKIDTTNASAADRLRWICVTPDTNQIALQPAEVVGTLAAMSSAELLILLPKFSANQHVRSSDFVDAVRQAMIDSTDSFAALRFASVLITIDPTWKPSRHLVCKILDGLTRMPLEEANQWSQLLVGLEHVVEEEIFSSTKQPNVRLGGSDSNRNSPQFIETTNLERSYLESEAIRKTVWQWMNRDGRKVVQFLQLAPIQSIRFVQGVPQSIRDETIQLVRAEYLRLKQQVRARQETKALTHRLQEMLERCDGFMGTERGVIHAIERNSFDSLIAALSENHLSLLSIHPYEMDGKDVFCAVFEESNEPCEVDWLVPLDEMESRIKQRRQSGWEAVSQAVHINPRPSHMAVLWRKGKWGPSKYIPNETMDAIRSPSDEDTADAISQLTEQSFRFGNDNFGVGLITSRLCPSRDESNRKFMLMNSAWKSDDFDWFTSLKLEFIADHEEIAKIQLCEPSHYLHQQELLIEMGYEPYSVFAQSGTGYRSSFWRKRLAPTRSEAYADMAKLAIACWLLGSGELVMESLQSTTPPAVRTAVIENLAPLMQDAGKILDLIQSETTPSQLQGLLLSLADASDLSNDSIRSRLKEKLKWCWTHPDSGVHFAADHLLRLKFPAEAWPVINPDHCERYGFNLKDKHRQWFYSSCGVPFVIIEAGTEAIYGLDEILPWSVAIDRHIEQIDQRFAISAVEIPDWLMQQFLSEYPSENLRHEYNIVPNGPAAGYSLMVMLKFCRWLSEKDGIPLDQIGLPEMENIKEGFRLPKAIWSQDGYRLPTNVEWEIAFRAGASTRHFLGDSLEYMQNYCWDSSNCKNSPQAIATRKPNPWGLFDMAGNLYDAVLGDHRVFSAVRSDIWEAGPLDKNTVLDIRGGSFLSSPIYSAAGSHHHTSAWGDINGGLRIVRKLPK